MKTIATKLFSGAALFCVLSAVAIGQAHFYPDSSIYSTRPYYYDTTFALIGTLIEMNGKLVLSFDSLRCISKSSGWQRTYYDMNWNPVEVPNYSFVIYGEAIASWMRKKKASNGR